MIIIYSDLGKNEYDIHSLTKAFYPHEDVKVDKIPEEASDRTVNSGDKEGRLVYCFEKGERLTLEIPKNDRDELKRTIYRVLSKRTGKELPWGALTGIRPVKMAMDRFRRGMNRQEVIRDMMTQYYVNQDKAGLCADIAVTESGILSGIEKDGFSLYIDVPFCPTTCLYCSFTSNRVGRDRSLVREYLKALFREIRKTGELFKSRKPDSVYIGGGTPTSLTPHELEELFSCLKDSFDINGAREFTVEAGRPDTIDRERLKVIKRYGASRICINPQTMNDRTLEVIGRAHTAQQVRDAYALAREEAIPHINMDVIAGLPGENEADFAHTLEEARKLHPESFTVHTLAIKRSSRMSLEKHPLPDGEMTARMVDAGRETARAMGMVPYYLYKQKQMAGNLENTGYALPGHACLYNVDIMEETSHILAMGAGGISKRIWPEEGHITRAPNVSNILEYISRTDEMISRKRELFPPLK